MFDLKVIHSVLDQMEQERGIPKEKMLEAIELALATAYKKEYGKKGQIVRATFDVNSGKTEFYQVKIVVDESKVIMTDDEEEQDIENTDEENIKVRFNPEHHILLADAKKIKKDAKIDDEIVFPLEAKADYGRIAAQTAKQVIIQKIREAEKTSVMAEYGQKEGEIVTGSVQRIERGILYIDMGRAVGILPYEEQIPSERYKQGERIRAYLYAVEESPKGIVLRLSRSHPKFLARLFEIEAPEIAAGIVEIKAIAREAGARSKIAVSSKDTHIDPIGSLVGQRGVRVSTVMSELGGEKIDIIDWNEDPAIFIEKALSPAKIVSIELNKEETKATVHVAEDQQSLAIGKGGQNVRLAAKLTGWKIDIQSTGKPAVTTEEGTDSK
ncbi:MAG: transcription termination/antitermination protein NusA [Candidatus Taylorbacteria bacterium]|nr:transcription termination/antitermination protein NusA [Candidatus Taylorbacteria bacterium]